LRAAYHVPVLLEEVLSFLPVDPDGIYVDGTLGGGGHARALANRLGPRGRLIGLDRDPEALAACRDLERDLPGRATLLLGDFGDLKAILRREGVERVSGILLDLGVSSRQLDEAGRGSSFLREGPLDMRMGSQAGGPTAADLVNGLPEEALADLFERYGEEPRARKIARAIVEARRKRAFEATGDLARLVERVLGRRGPKHPATRIFQALRIAVNRELEALEAVLSALPDLLAPGGRAVVISYHSLEDRMVKMAFRSEGTRCGQPTLSVLTRKVVKPGRAEVAGNPRSRSARLRAAERLPIRSCEGPGPGGLA
jgi:16S rRNA (cytosine1402-N4)-methyltransferase